MLVKSLSREMDQRTTSFQYFICSVNKGKLAQREESGSAISLSENCTQLANNGKSDVNYVPVIYTVPRVSRLIA